MSDVDRLQEKSGELPPSSSEKEHLATIQQVDAFYKPLRSEHPREVETTSKMSLLETQDLVRKVSGLKDVEALNKLFPEITGRSTPELVEKHREFLQALIQRNSPEDIQLLGSCLAKISETLLASDTVFRQAKDKYLEYFKELACSKDVNEIKFSQCLEVALKLDPPCLSTFLEDTNFITRFSNETAKLLISCLKQLPRYPHLEDLRKVAIKCETVMNKNPVLSEKEVFLLVNFTRLNLSADALKVIGPALAKTKDSFTPFLEWNQWRQKFLELFKDNIFSPDKTKPEILQALLEGVIYIASNSGWFENLLLDARFTDASFSAFKTAFEAAEFNKKALPENQKIVADTWSKFIELQEAAKSKDISPATLFQMAYLATKSDLTKSELEVLGKTLSNIDQKVIGEEVYGRLLNAFLAQVENLHDPIETKVTLISSLKLQTFKADENFKLLKLLSTALTFSSTPLDELGEDVQDMFCECLVQFTVSDKLQGNIFLFETFFNQAKKIDPEKWLSKILGHEKLTDDVITIVFEVAKKAAKPQPQEEPGPDIAIELEDETDPVTAVGKFITIFEENLVKLESMGKKNALSKTELLWLLSMEMGENLKLNECELKSVIQTLKRIEEDFKQDSTSYEIWENWRDKFVENFKGRILSSEDLDETFLQTALNGVLDLAPDSSWFEAILVDPKLTPEAAELLIKTLRNRERDIPESQKLISTILSQSLKQIQAGETTINSLRLAYFDLPTTDLNEENLAVFGRAIAQANHDIHKEKIAEWEDKFFQNLEEIVKKNEFPESLETFTKLIDGFPLDTLPETNRCKLAIKRLADKLLKAGCVKAFDTSEGFQNVSEFVTQNPSPKAVHLLRQLFPTEFETLRNQIIEHVQKLELEKDFNSAVRYALVFDNSLGWLESIITRPDFSDQAAKALIDAFSDAKDTIKEPYPEQLINASFLIAAFDTLQTVRREDGSQILPDASLLQLAYFQRAFQQDEKISVLLFERAALWLSEIPAELFKSESSLQEIKDKFFQLSEKLLKNLTQEESVKNKKQLENILRFALKIDPNFEHFGKLFENLLFGSYQHVALPMLLRTLKEVLSTHSSPPAELKDLVTHFESLTSPGIDIQQEYIRLFKELALTAFRADGFDKLGELIRHNLASEQIKLLREVASELEKESTPSDQLKTNLRIFKRFDQLHSGLEKEPEMEKISDEELFQIAVYIETEIVPIQNVSLSRQQEIAIYYTRDKTKLKRALIFDPKRKVVVISGTPTAESPKGGFKKIVDVVEVSLENLAHLEIAVRAYSRRKHGEKGPQELARDISLAETFGDIPEVVQINYSVGHHFTTKPEDGSKRIPRTSIGMEKLQVATKIVANPKIYDANQKAAICRDIINGLVKIHEKGWLHDDIKPANLLVNTRGGLKGKIGDLGLAVKYQKKGDASFKRYFGTPEYSGPEILCNNNFDGDPLLLEAFALGVSMYEMIHGKEPPWCKIINQNREKIIDDKLTKDEIEKIQKDIRETMEAFFKDKEYTDLLAKPEDKLTTEDKLKLLAYDMLQPDPIKRCSIEKAKDRIAKIAAPKTEQVV